MGWSSTQSKEACNTAVFSVLASLFYLQKDTVWKLPGRTENPAGPIPDSTGLMTTVQTTYLYVYPIFDHWDSHLD